MAGKTGTEDFLLRLQDLCLDYRAYRHIATHYLAQSEHLSTLLAEYRAANQSRVSEQFDGLTLDPQNDPLGTPPFQRVIDAISKATS